MHYVLHMPTGSERPLGLGLGHDRVTMYRSDALAEAVILSTGTPIPTQKPRLSAMADTEHQVNRIPGPAARAEG